jgi:hypothetical protein
MKKYVLTGIAALGIAVGSMGVLSPAHAYYYANEASQGNGN